MKTKGSLHPGSLMSNVLGFFERNPDEYLLLEDIEKKFHAERKTAGVVLGRAVRAGVLSFGLIEGTTDRGYALPGR